MPGLLSNLIERQRGTMPQVEPRPRSQYESIAGADTANVDRPVDDLAIDTTPSQTRINNPATDRQTQTHGEPLSTQKAQAPVNKSQPTARPPQRTNVTASDDQSANLQGELEPRLKTNPLETEPASSGGQRLSDTQLDTETDNQSSSIDVGDLDQRIAAVLAQIPTPNHSSEPTAAPTEPPSLLPIETNNTPLAADASAQPQEPQTDSPIITRTSEQQHSPDAPQTSHSTSSGVLETPTWLNELQNGLNRQNSEHQAPEPPTVNVTIGRVEVKAVRAPESKKTPRKKKASTVMSLDDYLKQHGGNG